MGKEGNFIILKPQVIWGVRAETTINGTCRWSSFARGQSLHLHQEVTEPVREKDWNTGALLVAHVEFQGGTSLGGQGKVGTG